VSRHLVSAVALWVALTAIGETTVLLDWFPVPGSIEAQDFDHIFRILLIMGFPVFAFVVAVVLYSMLQFRTSDPAETGATFSGKGAIPRVWLVVTSGLAVLVMIFPGLTGLAKLQSDPRGYGWGSEEAEMTVNVSGFRWNWSFEYAGTGVQLFGPSGELVLPVNREVRFEVQSEDVVHSFWIPAFRMKIDAIPGRTTFITVKPTELGSFQEDSAYRIQCAELCGLDHSGMTVHVRVVTDDEFQDWLASQQKQARGSVTR
jgi:cytochrome c oxidase subunit 2